jgi:DNA-binding MarR family transcriptional regulator
MDAMTASQVARTLAAKQLITREGDPHDTRVKRLRATPDGITRAQEAITKIEAIDVRYFSQAPDHAALVEALLALAPPPRSTPSGEAPLP